MKHGLAGPAMVADGWGARATVVLFRFVTFCAFALLPVVIFAWFVASGPCSFRGGGGRRGRGRRGLVVVVVLDVTFA